MMKDKLYRNNKKHVYLIRKTLPIFVLAFTLLSAMAVPTVVILHSNSVENTIAEIQESEQDSELTTSSESYSS